MLAGDSRRRSVGRIVVGIVIAFSVLSCSASLQALEKSKTECLPSFPLEKSWWGGDAAYSIPLPDGRSVWVFGDTLYGERRMMEGSDPRMVRNSIAVSTCDDPGGWKVDYVIRRDDKEQPQDFFQAQHKDTWYWPLDGFIYKNDLWVTLLCIRNVPRTTSTDLGFETCGADLAKISGLENDPQRWSVKYFSLVSESVRAYPSATAVVEGEFAYIFALLESDSRPMLLTRIPLDDLDAPAEHLQYLSKSGIWKPGLTPADAMRVMEHGNSEMTVRYHPLLKKWVAILNYPKFLSDEIVVRTAPQLAGPWSEGEEIYRIPEMQKGEAGYDKDTFCYAGKEHPEFRRTGSLVITYVCNTMSVPKLTSNLHIYFPKAVSVPFP